MLDYYRKISEEFDLTGYKRISTQTANYESSFCYKGFRKSAHFCAKELKRAGASVDIISLPADGKTTFLDHTLPEAFDVREAHLQLIEPEKRLLADLKEEPFCVANRCGNTPEGGVAAEVIEERDIDKEDIRGKIVFTKDFHPRDIRAKVVEKGGIGIISSYSEDSSDLPDGTWWINGWGSGPGWYHLKEDKKIFCFSISPGKGEYLKSLFRKGRKVKVHAEVLSRIYQDKIHTVSGLLPGRDQKEIIFLAHLYEPMLTDNATGAASLIEICRILNTLTKKGKIPPLRIGIRFLLSMERYGFAEFFAREENRKKVLCAINVDSISSDPKKTIQPVNVRINPMSHPFFGDFIMENLTHRYLSPAYPRKVEKGNFSDDTWICDTTIGIPVNWLWSHPGKYHHNSLDGEAVDFNLARNITSIIATYAYLLSTEEKEAEHFIRETLIHEAKKKTLEFYRNLSLQKLNSNDALAKRDFFAGYIQNSISSLARLRDEPDYRIKVDSLRKVVEDEGRKEWKRIKEKFGPSREKQLSPKDKMAKNMIQRRKAVGVPFCLADVPPSEKQPRPEKLDLVLNWMDGKRDLLQTFELVELEKEVTLSEKERAKLVRYLLLLSKHGYISINYSIKLTKNDIKEGLKQLGINKGDRIIVHSSLASLGYVKGGPKTVCQAIMELVADKGIVMMPSFNHEKAFEEAGYYSPLETRTTNGAIPDAFWRLKNVFRSLHPTHAVAVWGKNARNYVKDHHKVLTMGEGSPLHLLEKNGGKVVLIDAPGANTFHHIVEMTNNVPCLGKRTDEFPVKLPSGEIVKCRAWSYRNSNCPCDDTDAYRDIMRRKGLLNEGKIGMADVIVFKMSDCRKVIEKLIKGKAKGFAGCKKCKVKPWVKPNTVESDWDDEKKKVKPTSPAFTGDWL